MPIFPTEIWWSYTAFTPATTASSSLQAPTFGVFLITRWKEKHWSLSANTPTINQQSISMSFSQMPNILPKSVQQTSSKQKTLNNATSEALINAQRSPVSIWGQRMMKIWLKYFFCFLKIVLYYAFGHTGARAVMSGTGTWAISYIPGRHKVQYAPSAYETLHPPQRTLVYPE